jgi:hypothetical protein
MQVSKDAFFHNMVYVMRTWSKQALKSLREPYEKENSRSVVLSCFSFHVSKNDLKKKEK